MIRILSKLTPVDITVSLMFLGLGLMFIAYCKRKEVKTQYPKAVKPRKDEIRRADILDAKLSRDHDQYVHQARVRLDEHEQALAN